MSGSVTRIGDSRSVDAASGCAKSSLYEYMFDRSVRDLDGFVKLGWMVSEYSGELLFAVVDAG